MATRKKDQPEDPAKLRRRIDRRIKQQEKKEQDEFEANCCLYIYPGSSGWSTCHKCKQPLVYRLKPKRGHAQLPPWMPRQQPIPPEATATARKLLGL